MLAAYPLKSFQKRDSFVREWLLVENYPDHVYHLPYAVR